MALASSVTGTGILVSKAPVVTRYIIISPAGGKTTADETKTTTVHEWVAVEEAAAVAWAAATPPPISGSTISRRITEENRILRSFKCEETVETITIVSTYEPPAE